MTEHTHILSGHHVATVSEQPCAPLHNTVSHPSHYTANGFKFSDDPECLTFTRHMGFDAGNAFKYIWRAGCKGDWEEDLAKARFYINDIVEHNLSYHHPVLTDILELLSPGESRVNSAKLAVLRRIVENRLFGIENHLKELEEALREEEENLSKELEEAQK